MYQEKQIKSPNAIKLRQLKQGLAVLRSLITWVLRHSFQFLARVESRCSFHVPSRQGWASEKASVQKIALYKPPPPELRSDDRRAARTAGRLWCCCYQTVWFILRQSLDSAFATITSWPRLVDTCYRHGSSPVATSYRRSALTILVQSFAFLAYSTSQHS